MRESIGDWLRQVPGLGLDFLLWKPLNAFTNSSLSYHFFQWQVYKKKLCISKIGLLLGKSEGIGNGAEYAKPLSASLHVPESSKLCLTVEAKIIILPRMVLSVCGGNIWNFVIQAEGNVSVLHGVEFGKTQTPVHPENWGGRGAVFTLLGYSKNYILLIIKMRKKQS